MSLILFTFSVLFVMSKVLFQLISLWSECNTSSFHLKIYYKEPYSITGIILHNNSGMLNVRITLIMQIFHRILPVKCHFIIFCWSWNKLLILIILEAFKNLFNWEITPVLVNITSTLTPSKIVTVFKLLVF